MGVCVAQSQRMFQNLGGKKLSALINDWEKNIAYWEESKQTKDFSCKYDSFQL